jgi:hypothetical protein
MFRTSTGGPANREAALVPRHFRLIFALVTTLFFCGQFPTT